MLGMSDYLGLAQAERSSDSICLIGGHYAFPGAPDKFAIESARAVLCAQERLLAAGHSVQSHVFLDDIAASEACSAVGCGTRPGLAPRIGAAELPRAAEWLAASLAQLERRLIESDAPEWRGLAAELATELRAEHAPVPDLAGAALEPSRVELDDWLAAVEALSYVAARPLLRPLRLSRALRHEAPPVVLERSMTNAASRMLHKLKKQLPTDGAGLRTSQLESGQLSYWVAGSDARPIELRRESAERAANKCAGILSQLFYHCAKRAGARPDARLTLFYLIPCYDRARVADGVLAFARLYADTRRWFGVTELRVATALYCGVDRELLLCDELVVQHGGSPRMRTFQLAPDALSSRRTAVALPRQVYADNNSTTATDPTVVAELLPYLTGLYGNASSSHSFGWTAELAVGQAAREVAALINAEPDEIFFTSGATEANNWVFQGESAASLPPLVSSPIEHKSVLEAVSHAAEAGRELIRLPINREGQVNIQALAELRLPPRSLVSLMAVNNEVHGVLELARVGEICAQRGAIFHTDAAQAIGAIPIDVKGMKIGMLSLSAHKIYGPKGVGALFVARALQPAMRPLLRGGGQQGNLRSGTLPTALIVGLGKACALASAALASEGPRLERLGRSFLQQLSSRGVSYRIIGPSNLQHRRPGSLCLIIDDLDCTRLCEWMPEVAVSQGSACNSRGIGSHVLRELGLSLSEARSVIRLAFGRFNGERDVTYVVKRLVNAWQEHRSRQVRPAAGDWPPQLTAV